jgi:hypothetical protein
MKKAVARTDDTEIVKEWTSTGVIIHKMIFCLRDYISRYWYDSGLPKSVETVNGHGLPLQMNWNREGELSDKSDSDEEIRRILKWLKSTIIWKTQIIPLKRKLSSEHKR